nr:hypothetical protein [Acuticoccus mangrovi]
MASSLASDLAKAICPAFDAAQAQTKGMPSVPATEVTLTARPQRRAAICGTRALAQSKVPTRSIVSTLRTASKGESPTAARGPRMPALFTRMWMRP